MSLGENIRRLRKARGLTQEDLGQRLEMSAQAVSKWERDECLPDAALLPKLADELGSTLDRLFDRTLSRYDDAAAAAINWLLTLSGEERWAGALRLGRIVQTVLMGSWEIPEFKDIITLEFFDDPRMVTGSICSEAGFTFSSRRESLPYLILFPEPKAGWGPCLREDDPAFWEALAKPEVRRALLRMFAGELPDCFDAAWAAKEFGPDLPEEILEMLEALGALQREDAFINDAPDTLWFPTRPLRLMTILLLGVLKREQGWGFNSGRRTAPLLRTREEGQAAE